jgi:tetratricopeptide (TPR) repeat protein
LGVVLKDKHDYAGAVVALNESVRLDPSIAVTHFVLGNVLFTAGEHAAAEEAYLRATDLEPGNDRFWCNLGITAAESDAPQAHDYFLKALCLCPSNVLALTHFASYLARKGEYLRAISYYTEALRFPPVASNTYVNIGIAWFKLHCYSDSEEAMQKALKISSRNVQAHVYLGKLNFAKGFYLHAEMHLRWAIELDDIDEEAQAIMRTISGTAVVPVKQQRVE